MLFLPETRLYEHSAAGVLKVMGYRLCSVLRPLNNTHNSAVGGGIAFLTRITTLVSMDAAPDKRGAASVIISVPGKERVAIIGAYLPPLNRDNEELRDELLLYVSREYRRLSGQYKTLVCMDANARCHEVDGVVRLTTPPPRVTATTIAPPWHKCKPSSTHSASYQCMEERASCKANAPLANLGAHMMCATCRR